MARKFLYFVAFMIILIMCGAFYAALYPEKVTQFYYDGLTYQTVPETEFVQQEALEDNIYADPAMWHSVAGQVKNNPTTWQPEGAEPLDPRGPAAIFFVHPTSFISNEKWNANLSDAETNNRARTFLRGLSSPFASAGEIWAPKYRQATIGAFLTDKAEGQNALDAAYQDVLQAFDHFIAQQKPDTPIILAGHSQGSRHLTYLLRDRVAGKPLAQNIVSAYIVGWPISLDSDLPALGLPKCSAPDQIGCIMSWQSYAEPADYNQVTNFYDASEGLTGQSRKDTNIVCTNPLNGGSDITADKSANLGTMLPSKNLEAGELVKTTVPARCNNRGFLLIGEAPNMGLYILPGNNFHVYDYPLFWANTRIDALRRLRAFIAK